MKPVMSALAVAGLGGLVAALWHEPAHLSGALLVTALFITTVGLGGLTALLTHQTTGGDWGDALAPWFRGLAAVLPIAVVPFALLLAVGYPHLQAVAADAAGRSVAAYLAPTWLALRIVVCFAAWTALTLLAWTLMNGRGRRSSFGALGLVVLLPTVFVFDVDWVVALEPHWYTSANGLVLSAAAVPPALALALFAAAPRLEPPVRRQSSRLLLAALLFWMYVAYMEFLIIWSANLPHEVSWYVPRGTGRWQVLLIAGVAALVLVCGALTWRTVRGSVVWLRGVCALVVAIHAMYLAWLVLPSLTPVPVWAVLWGLACAGVLVVVALTWIPTCPQLPEGRA